MKLASLLTGMVMVGLVTVGNTSFKAIHPSLAGVAVAAEAKQAGPSAEEKIALITKNKGQIGSGDQLRRFFYGDLEPLAVQPGGAGMVVNLYNKASDTTFAYCATYDVVVAVKKGKISQFLASEVK
ncbi:hypothetical protein K9N68_39450 (plasmid) [Kovacikia minuta CCNUW1]|uniref:hypothetical protein n=1 Tax=Kovacikia minuta TaxID=2931930 RepID=UPI001CCF4228|nr:hypothetical protein [Kovacikia minuta]UBF30206.1 hypothetical protein K9N68_39450 [Kovacikia minuta CCNUW1]